MSLNTPRKFHIRSPCSTANIGPGFDVLGISLSLYLTMDVELLKEGSQDFEMTYSGEGANDVPLTPEKNLITKTALYVLSANGISELPKPLKIHVHNPIPLGRGLGSSGAAVVSGVLLGNALGQLKLSRDRLLDYCLMIERHPDNVAAALMGGFVASYLRELDPSTMQGIPASESLLDIALSQKVPQPPLGIGHYIQLNWAKEIKCVAIVPQFQVATIKARAVLPTHYDRKDVIFNFQRLAVLTTALGQSPPDANLIYNAMQDKIHQPYRKTLIPGLPEILSGLTPENQDGLLGICLSGAGPTILALATKNYGQIAQAAMDLFKEHGGFECFYKVLDVVTDGSTCSDALELGQTCDASALYKSGTFEYDDSCKSIYLFCDPTSNTCNYKGCSNSDYIKNWDTTFRPIPTRCNSKSFCPDSHSRCTELLPVGARCEMQRDDECAGSNSICLNATCFIKGAPLGGNCGADTTVYYSQDADESMVQQTIIRDNCTDGTYCLGSTCVLSKGLNAVCDQDRECLSGSCSNEGICIQGPDVFHVIKSWLWGVLGAAIVIFVLLVLGLLWILHRYQSKKEHAKAHKFFGDNEEFSKYALMGEMHQVDSNRTSLLYLTTPDYLKSQALSTSHKNPSSLSLHQPKARANQGS
ncbi:hypothetical protein BY458DRAFT_549906 [Sporodiniella umbellata]|nr:hypothetical protein BY458DRAFT_549906 [Sporodiniella umbellata]